MKPGFGLIAALAFVIFGQGKARAFPDLIRHNYVNCTACHVSPTGGGVLNAYGRSMSRELLSAKGHEREGEFLHGALPEGLQPDWLQIGGDARVIGVHRESPSLLSERWFVMQTSPEVAVTAQRLSAAISIGQAERATRQVRWVSPRYFLQWTPLDELAVRVGKFIPVFGLNVPYHPSPTRQSLGFAPGQERHTIESVWSGEGWNLGASASQTPASLGATETLFTAQMNRNFLGSYRIGLSVLHGSSDEQARRAASAHALLGFTDRLAYLSEFTFQRQEVKGGTDRVGLYHFSQLLYEIARGWNIYFLEDYEKSDLGDSTTLAHSLGPGIRFFPRPHLELDGVFLKKRVAAVADRYDDFAWLMVHYYF